MHTYPASGTDDILYVSPVTDERVEVHYKKRENMVDVSPNLDIFVACLATCWSRLRLYEVLELLGYLVLYFDIDSGVSLKDPTKNP